MLRTVLGSRVQFTPTNIGEGRAVDFRSIARHLWLPFLAGIVVSIGIATRNFYLLFSPNLFWLGLWLSSPLILWLFHRDQRASVEENNHEL